MKSIQSTINKFYNTNIAIRLIEKWIKSFKKLLELDISNKTKEMEETERQNKPKTIEVLEMGELYSKYYDYKKTNRKN